MKINKILAILIVAGSASVILTGCGNNDKDSKENDVAYVESESNVICEDEIISSNGDAGNAKEDISTVNKDTNVNFNEDSNTNKDSNTNTKTNKDTNKDTNTKQIVIKSTDDYKIEKINGKLEKLSLDEGEYRVKYKDNVLEYLGFTGKYDIWYGICNGSETDGRVNDIYMVHENQDDVIYRIHWSDLTKHPKHEFESGKYGIYNVGGNVNKLVMLSFDGNKLTYINTLEDVPCIREFETNNSSFSYIAGVKTESPTAEHLVIYTKDGNLEMVPLS